MFYFEPQELDFISARLQILIAEARKTNEKEGVLLKYEELSLIVDHQILTEAIISELCNRLLEHDIIIVYLGALFLVIKGEEAIKFAKASTEMIKKSMSDKICFF